MGVFDHDDRRIDHGADGNGDAAEAHDVRTQAQQVHAQIGDQNAERQRDDRHQRAAHVQQKHHAHQRHDDAFLDQGAFERVDGAVDQVRAVVDRVKGDAFRQTRRDFREPLLDVLDDGKSVLAEALQHDAGNDFSLTVQFGDAAPLVGHQFDAGDVAQQNRHALVGLDDDLFEIGQVFEVAAAAHHEFGLGELDGAAANIDIARTQEHREFSKRYAERLQPARIDHHAVLLDEAADAGDFGDAFRLGKTVADIPILNVRSSARFICTPRTTY